MTATTTQTLVATARNGSTVTLRTRAEYTQAAIVPGPEGGEARLIAKGWTVSGVTKRARTILGSHNFEVRPFKVTVQGVAVRDIPEDIADHFDRKRLPGYPRQIPMIVQVFMMAEGNNGWADIKPAPATWTAIRELAAQGAHTISCQAYGSPYADFPIEPMLRKAGLPLLGGALIGSKTKNRD